MKSVSVNKSYPTIVMFAAACAADRITAGEYVKEPIKYVQDPVTGKYQTVNVKTSRQLVTEFLENLELITDADRERAEDVQRHFQGLTFKALTHQLKDFDMRVLSLSSQDEIDTGYIGMIACLPSRYTLERGRMDIDNRLADSTREHIGAVDERVSLDIEVLRINYSQKWNCHCVSALTAENRRVFFMSSKPQPPEVNKKYSIVGTVKRHDSEFVTVLGRVKVKNWQ